MQIIDLLLWPKLISDESALNFVVAYLFYSALILVPVILTFLGIILTMQKNTKKMGYITLLTAGTLGIISLISGSMGAWAINNWLLALLYIPLGPILLYLWMMRTKFSTFNKQSPIPTSVLILAILLIYFVTIPVAISLSV